MSAYLPVALHGGSALLQVHALDNGVLAVSVFYGKYGFLPAFFTFKRFFLCFTLCLIGRKIGEKVQLNKLIFLRHIALMDNVICGDVQPP